MEKKRLNEYCTPDELDLPDGSLSYRWNNGITYPFIMTHSFGTIFGEMGEKHDDMRYALIAAITDTTVEDVKAVKEENYYYCPEGRREYFDDDSYDDEPYFAIGDEEVDEDTLNYILYFLGEGEFELQEYTSYYGRIWVEAGDYYESYISLWLEKRLDYDNYEENYDDVENGQFSVGDENYDRVPSFLPPYVIEECAEIFKHFDCDLDYSYIAIGNTVLPINELLYGKKQVKISNDDLDKNEKQRIIHNLSPEEKWNETEGWRNVRDNAQSEKLAYKDHDGNRISNKTPMTMAQYNNLIHQEGKNVKKTLIKLTENDLHNLIRNSVKKALKEGVFNYTESGLEEDSNTEEMLDKSNLAREIYKYLKTLVNDVHIGGSQIELYINDMNKFAADKVAQKYRGRVRITHLERYRQYKILVL